MFLKTEIKLKEYELIFLGNNLWQLRSNDGIFTGSLDLVYNYAISDLGFKNKEISLAVKEMEKEFHNAACFSVFKDFMWTFEKESMYNKKIAN